MGYKEAILTELTLPAHTSYLRMALNFIEESAKQFSPNEEELNKIVLASEEGIENTITHGFGNNISESFNILCVGKSYQFEIHIFEKGKPYNPSEIQTYEPIKCLDDNLSGLGTFLMKSLSDEVQFNNLGRKGKETVIIKYLSNNTLDISKMSNANIEDIGDFNYSIRPFNESDATAISECAYAAYGYSYESYIYYPEKIVQMNKDKKIVSIVTEADNGDIAGHLALKYNSNPYTAEMGVGFVSPKYRRKHLFKEMSDYIMEMGVKDKELKCIFASAVTGHTGSQKNLIKMDYNVIGIMLALLPSDVDFKNLAGVIKQKESAVLAAKILKTSSPQEVYLPIRYRDIIHDLFDKLGIELVTGRKEINTYEPNDDDLFRTNIVDVLNIGVIDCNFINEETAHEIRLTLRDMCTKQLSTIFIYISLTDSNAPYMIEKCNDMGFIFSGIQPYWKDGNHCIVMQYINNTMLDFESIKLADEFALKLREYIKADYESTI